MLTGDENIVDINFIVLWVIKDAKDYLFNVRNPDGTVKSAAESAMREVIGHTEIASAFAEGRGKIETDTQTLLQEILDSYKAGIEIQNVQLQKRRSAGAGHRRLPRRAERQDRRAAPHQRGAGLQQQCRAGGAWRCRAHRRGGRGLSPAGGAQGRRRRGALPFGLQRLQSWPRT